MWSFCPLRNPRNSWDAWGYHWGLSPRGYHWDASENGVYPTHGNFNGDESFNDETQDLELPNEQTQIWNAMAQKQGTKGPKAWFIFNIQPQMIVCS